MCEKIAKKKKKNVQRPSGNTVKNVRKNILWKKNIAGTAGRTTFEREKKIHGIFHFFRARLSAALCWRGWGLWLMGPISVAFVGTGACVCIHPSLPACFPDEAHLWTRVLAYFWQVLLLLVLALDWSSRGGCGRKPLTLCPFWRVSKNVKTSNVFFTPCFCRPPQDKISIEFRHPLIRHPLDSPQNGPQQPHQFTEADFSWRMHPGTPQLRKMPSFSVMELSFPLRQRKNT